MGRAITIGLPLIVLVSSVDVSIRLYDGVPGATWSQVIISWMFVAIIGSMMRGVAKTQREIDDMDKRRGE